LQIAGALIIIIAGLIAFETLRPSAEIAIVIMPSVLAGGTLAILVLSITRRSGTEAAATAAATLLIVACVAFLLPAETSRGESLGEGSILVLTWHVPVICALCGVGIFIYGHTAR
jgi:hypothetical protein